MFLTGCFWQGMILLGCDFDGVCFWRGVFLTGCDFDGLWFWWVVVLMGCGFDGLWFWRVVVLTGCVFDRGVFLTGLCFWRGLINDFNLMGKWSNHYFISNNDNWLCTLTSSSKHSTSSWSNNRWNAIFVTPYVVVPFCALYTTPVPVILTSNQSHIGSVKTVGQSFIGSLVRSAGRSVGRSVSHSVVQSVGGSVGQS